MKILSSALIQVLKPSAAPKPVYFKQLQHDTVSFSAGVKEKSSEEYKELLESVNGITYKEAGIRENSPEFKRALDLMKTHSLCSEDALDIILEYPDDEKRAAQAAEIFSRNKDAVNVSDVMNLLSQGLSSDDIDMIGECAADGEGIDALYDMTQDGTALQVMKIYKGADCISLSDAFNYARKVSFDAEKIDEAAELAAAVDTEGFDILDAVNIKAYENNFSVEEIKEAAELREDNPDLYAYSINGLLGMIKKYGAEKIENVFKMFDAHNISFRKVPLSKILDYSDEKLQTILNFASENSVPFSEADAFYYFIENPRKTSPEEIFPKDLTDEELTAKYQDGSSWNERVSDMYQQIRRAGNYAAEYGENNFSGNYGDFYRAVRSPEDVKAENFSGWTYHAPKRRKDYKGGMPLERISLNVKGCADLIKTLDNIMIDTNYAFVYKMPEVPAEWGTREDPVTMYFTDKIPGGLFDRISEAVKPFARGSLNGAENSAAPYIMKETYTSGSMIEDLIKRAENLDKDLAETIKKDASKTGELQLSTGQYKAYRRIMDEYERYLNIKK